MIDDDETLAPRLLIHDDVNDPDLKALNDDDEEDDIVLCIDIGLGNDDICLGNDDTGLCIDIGLGNENERSFKDSHYCYISRTTWVQGENKCVGIQVDIVLLFPSAPKDNLGLV